MALYSMYGLDHPGRAEDREPPRAVHRAYVEANLERIRLAGALLDDDGAQVGSLIVFEADSAEEVWAWIRAEPFYLHGIYRTIDVKPWNLVIGGIA